MRQHGGGLRSVRLAAAAATLTGCALTDPTGAEPEGNWLRWEGRTLRFVAADCLGSRTVTSPFIYSFGLSASTVASSEEILSARFSSDAAFPSGVPAPGTYNVSGASPPIYPVARVSYLQPLAGSSVRHEVTGGTLTVEFVGGAFRVRFADVPMRNAVTTEVSPASGEISCGGSPP